MSNAREHSKFAAIFAAGTLFSRILGLIRDLVWVALIPVASLEAFIVAFRFPNMLREIIGEGASNAAFVPTFTEALTKKNEEEFRELVSAVMSAMIIILGLMTLLGVLLLPSIISSVTFLEKFVDKGPIPPEKIALITELSLWTFPYLFMICMAIFCMAPLYTLKHYVTPSWTPALLNIAIIFSCVFFRNSFAEPAYALVLGIWLGGMAQMIVQYLALGKYAGIWIPNFKLNHPGIRTILWLLVPVIIGQAAGEVNRAVDILFAAALPEEGSVRSLFLANRLVQLPLSVFAVATSVAILPSLSKSSAMGRNDEIRTTLMQGLRQSYFLVFPAMLGLMVLGKPVVSLLFQYGEFDTDDVDRTATALWIYAAGLLAFAWVKVTVTGFFAVKDTRTPVLIASGCMLLNILLNFVLIGPLGYQGLALSTTLSFTLNCIFLYAFLSVRFGPLWDAEYLTGLGKMSIASVFMAVVALGTYRITLGAVPDDGLISRLALVFVPMGLAGSAYAIISRSLRIPEYENLRSLLRRR